MPERWLEAENGGQYGNSADMNRFLVPFSKGTRGCIGINPAYMELYFIIAYLVRQFDFETETTEEDMRWDDMVIAWFHGDFTVMAKRGVN
jgi:cytochrome P450